MTIVRQLIIILLALVLSIHCRIHLRHLSQHRSHRIQSSDLDNATVEHSGSYYTINTASRVVKTMNVPDVFQATDYTCGPASMTAVLNFFHMEQREADLAKLAKTNDQIGTDPYDMLEAFRKLGVKAQMNENMTIAQVENYVSKGWPVILLIQAWKDEDDPTPYPEDMEDGHYVVVIGSDNQYFYIEDPWIIGSLVYIRKTDLYVRWHGNTLYPRERVIYGCGIAVMGANDAINPLIQLK